MAKSSKKAPTASTPAKASLIQHQRGKVTQAFGTVIDMPTALKADARLDSVNTLNQVLADTITLRDMYKKHHWQVAGHTFYQLHLLYDKHADELTELIDEIGERIQILGGLAVAMAADIAEMTKIKRPPKGRESVPVQIDRLLEAHELLIREARETADKADDNGDHATNDLMASKLIPRLETQVWFVGEHVVDVPIVRSDETESHHG